MQPTVDTFTAALLVRSAAGVLAIASPVLGFPRRMLWSRRRPKPLLALGLLPRPRCRLGANAVTELLLHSAATLLLMLLLFPQLQP